MPKIEVGSVPLRQGCGYPFPFDQPCAGRTRRRLGGAGGLEDFGLNLMTLPPGGWSSQRHWHSHEDEFVYVLEGELVLVEDGGETILHAGDCAAFPKGTGNGLSGSGLAQQGRSDHLRRCRHDELQCRRQVRSQGRVSVSPAVATLSRRQSSSPSPAMIRGACFSTRAVRVAACLAPAKCSR